MADPAPPAAASPPPERPATVLLVHGAWHGAWCWAALQAELDRLGIPSLAVDLPGHGLSPEPLGDLQGDAAFLAATLARIPSPVVLVGHSYGGAVITQAGARAGDVRHLVYVAAFVPDGGETVLGLAQQSSDTTDLAAAMLPGDEGTFVLEPEAAAVALYGDVGTSEVTAALARLSPQPMATFTQPVEDPAWRTIPSTYVVCATDRAVPPPLQRTMAERCTGVVELPTAHSPFLSMPDRLAAILAPLAGLA